MQQQQAMYGQSPIAPGKGTGFESVNPAMAPNPKYGDLSESDMSRTQDGRPFDMGK